MLTRLILTGVTLYLCGGCEYNYDAYRKEKESGSLSQLQTQKEPQMNDSEACQTLTDVLQRVCWAGNPPKTKVTNEAIKFFPANGGTIETIHIRKTDVTALRNGPDWAVVDLKSPENSGRLWHFQWVSFDDAQRFASAFISLKLYLSTHPSAYDAAALADFQDKARAWLALPDKPSPPIEVKRFRVLAEDAYQNKEFDKAAYYYEQGLSVQPLWPSGHFNAAQLYGALEDYEPAIFHLKCYLALRPDANNAQAMQEKIWLWEEKLKEPSKINWAGCTSNPYSNSQPVSECFVATAAYGSPWEINVFKLRQFRDSYLLTNSFGRKLVDFYYHHSPPVADFIRNRAWARFATCAALKPFVIIAGATLGYRSDLLMLGMALIISIWCSVIVIQRFKKRGVKN